MNIVYLSTTFILNKLLVCSTFSRMPCYCYYVGKLSLYCPSLASAPANPYINPNPDAKRSYKERTFTVISVLIIVIGLGLHTSCSWSSVFRTPCCLFAFPT